MWTLEGKLIVTWSLNKERDISVIKDRKGGSTILVVAKRHGISMERVRQIVAKYDRRCRWLNAYDRKAVGFQMNDEFDIVGGPEGDDGGRP